MTWMQRLRRVYDQDVSVCANCGGAHLAKQLSARLPGCKDSPPSLSARHLCRCQPASPERFEPTLTAPMSGYCPRRYSPSQRERRFEILIRYRA